MSAAGVPGQDPTSPDVLDADAREQLDLLNEERIVRCWKVPYGYLVVTTLRCIYVWKRHELLQPSEGWQTGPTFMFYKMAPPRIVAWRFVELSEDPPFSQDPFRFLVRNPAQACADIDAARQAGRAAWTARRALVHRLGATPTPFVPPPGSTVVVREVVKIRCSYCGALMNEGAPICPRCGAPPK